MDRDMYDLKNCYINSNTFIIANSTPVLSHKFHLVGILMDAIELV